jgi:hypothetical protein
MKVLCRAGVGLLVMASAQAGDMTVLTYRDQDPGDPAYPTRVLVTPDFLRMDSGEDDGDFVLLDRKARKVMNVMREMRMTMIFAHADVPPRPAAWKSRLRVEPPAGTIQRYRLQVNGQLCSEGRVDRGAAPDAARAMVELKAVLAATQYRVWRDSPAGMQHDCDLANQVWDIDGVLRLGLPLEENEYNGRTRTLQARGTQPYNAALFRLPAGFADMTAPGL